MKMNWKTAKILVACMVIIGAIFWAFNAIRPRNYDGGNLSFAIGNGSVSLTNPLPPSVSVQIVGTGSRSFRVSSPTESLSGTSTRQGNGAATAQIYTFDLPSGTSEFTVSNGTNVNFIATTPVELQATVNPVDGDTRLSIIVAALFIVLGSLFYISHTDGHHWLSAARRQKASDLADEQAAESQNFDRIFAGRNSNRPKAE